MIELQGIGKMYRMYKNPGQRLLDWVTPSHFRFHTPFWALKDVSLRVDPGRTVGVIGANGAGKSTLLKLISGISSPSTGTLRVKGRVAALLELGAGFHPEFTGRDNLAMNARMLGLTESQIAEKLPEMIAFSELGRFIDQPVRTYSSGMYVRLGFAAVSGIDPDVLIIDEALSVGDAYFQRKCLERIRLFREQGKTILVVSHSLDLIRRFCDDALWLDQGHVRAQGEVNSVVRAYEMYSKKQEEIAFSETVTVSEAGSQTAHVSGPLKPFRVLSDSWGNGKIRITKVDMIGPDGRSVRMFNQIDTVTVRLHYYSMVESASAVFGINVHTENGIYLFGTNNFHMYHRTIPIVPGPGCLDITLPRLSLHAGRYLLTVGCHAEPDEPFWSDFADYHFQAYPFRVWSESLISGYVDIPVDFRPHPAPLEAACGVPDHLDFASKQTPHYLFGDWWDIEEGIHGHVSWTAREAGFLISVPRDGQTLSLEVLGGRPDISDRAPCRMTVKCGDSVLHDLTLHSPSWTVLEIPLPAHARGKLLQARLIVDPVWTPSAYGVPEDVRTLGVCVRRIQVIPSAVKML